MKLLLNFIPIKKGGGQQVATNFVNQIVKYKNINLVFLVTEGTYIHSLLKTKDLNIIEVKNNLFLRFLFQKFRLHNIVSEYNIDIIYTMFGPSIKSKNTLSVSGCAYSNIFFPEINFWNDHSFLNKIKLKIIDTYRLKSTLNSDAIIFENKSMQLRANELFNYPLAKTKLILPSISEYKSSNLEDISQFNEINRNHFNILMLTGWHKNKNLEIIPLILEKLKNIGHNDVSFVVSVKNDHPNSIKLLNHARKLNVLENIILIGSVEPNYLPLLFKKINAVGLFSLLESFSNNIIEAWYFQKPLFISDLEWSRAICKNAAIYIDRVSAIDITDNIINYRNNKVLQQTIKTNAKSILTQYPSPDEKVKIQLNYLKQLLNESKN